MTTYSESKAPADMAAQITVPASYAEPTKVHEALRWLRENQPVSRVVTPDYDPFWLVSRHADILDIERRAELFPSGDRSTILVGREMLSAIAGAFQSPHLTRSVVNMDGREHRVYRMLTQSWFMPGNVNKLADRIRAIARAHIDRMFERGGSCDFVADVALHYPLHVIMEILGVPEEDEGKMLVLTQQLFGARDPELSRAADQMNDPASALLVFQSVLDDFYRYFGRISESRRAEPREDVATVIANAMIDGEPISEHEANSYYVLVATAGHDTTSASTAGGVLALAQEPHLLSAVKENPALIPNLVDEAIRWVTPVKHFMRSAAQDLELHGQQIKAGDWLMLSYMSANRDAAVFEQPGRFRLDRPLNKQLAFGFGPHVCLGQHLAKLEMRIFFEELIPRVRSIELADAPAWTQSSFISGPKRLPVNIRPA